MSIEILMKRLASPAQRAIQSLNITSLEQLSNYTEKEILNLHGIGKNAVIIIKMALNEKGLSLK